MNILLYLINRTTADDIACKAATVCTGIAVMAGMSIMTTCNIIDGEVEEAMNRARSEESVNTTRRKKVSKMEDVGNGQALIGSLYVGPDGSLYTRFDTVLTNEYLEK